MTSNRQPPSSGESITRARIDALVRFLPAFADSERPFIERWAGEESADSGIGFLYPVYAPDVVAFFQEAGQPWWTDYRYNPQVAARLIEDDAYIARATLPEIKTLLTYCVRGERFGAGHWEAVLRTGRIAAILCRLADLRESVE